MVGGESRPELAQESPIPLNPAAGSEIGLVYEAFLSPMQEGGEETEAPKAAKGLQSTAPSTERAQRASRGYGQLRFTQDLSKAYVEVTMEGVKSEDIVMFHIHCGPPGVLGPIIVDLGAAADLGKAFADGHELIEIDNSNIKMAEHAPGLKPRLPEGCPVDKGFLTGVKTIGGLEYLARRGALYFNLHTKAHTYYGEMRGQIYLVDD
ncbi:MAG: CHRD domain-containing protein [Deltaproteobacteria bacterium]|nr:CHRD domain-containing protein [Deltaproteobacteria bacterium]